MELSKMIKKKKKQKKELPKHVLTVQLIGKIISEPEKTTYGDGERTKTFFKIKTSLDNIINVVYWENTNLRIGDEVWVEGNLNTVTMTVVIWKMLIYKRSE